MKHLGFSGTRYGMTDEQFRAVGHLVADIKATHYHHGDCIGADAQFHNLVLPLGEIIIHPPAVDYCRAHCTMASAWMPSLPFLERNRAIVDASDALIAAPHERVEQQRGGTWSTLRYAREIGKPLYLVLPNGLVLT